MDHCGIVVSLRMPEMLMKNMQTNWGMRIEEGSCPVAYATNQTMRHTFSFASINVSFHFIPFTIDDCSETSNVLPISKAGRHKTRVTSVALTLEVSIFQPQIHKNFAFRQTTVIYSWYRRLVLLKDEKQTNAILNV